MIYRLLLVTNIDKHIPNSFKNELNSIRKDTESSGASILLTCSSILQSTRNSFVRNVTIFVYNILFGPSDRAVSKDALSSSVPEYLKHINLN